MGAGATRGRLMAIHVALVIGTRPELIKLAPVAQALTVEGARVSIVLTGQHPALDLAGAGLHAIDCMKLDLPPLGHEPLAMVASICAGTQAALRLLQPDWVVVQGDTSSALGGARAAALLGLPLGHVEAGLRSGHPSMPWPEEPFRQEIDAISDILFAPTPGARDNLLAEQTSQQIVVTGNTGIDALRAVMTGLPPHGMNPGLPWVLLTAHRRENLGEEMGRIAEGVRAAAARAAFRLLVITHPRPDTAALVRRAFAQIPRTRLLLPQSATTMVRLMLRASVILSDSGGVSEEAPTLGRPLLILRSQTERPEAVATGSALLVGTDPVLIRDGLLELLEDPVLHAARAMPRPVFGDGHAATRIVKHLLCPVALGVAAGRLDASIRAA